jgi:serine/threonine-protein kinase
MTAAADRHLLFGLLALQNGLIDQGQLMLAFQAWTRDKSKSLADHLEARGDLTAAKRALLDALAELHLEAHEGDVEKSLAAIPAGRSTRESLCRLADADVEASIGHLATALIEAGNDGDRTASYGIGTATSDGLRFRVLRPHARGGLGAVFVALDNELHREVALKQILDRHADDPTSRARFLQEAEITGGLEHPGIVPVYGLGTYADGRPFYAMRFIRGDSLREAIERFHADEAAKSDPGRRSLELRKLLRRFTDVCDAIDYAHSRGVLHRDIKPGNIIVGKHGETLVVDWGLAKATGRAEPGAEERTLRPSSASGSAETLPGSALGTPAYMSPEQARGDLESLGPASDVYALGATLHCLLTGGPPFEDDDLGLVLRRVQDGAFPRPRALEPKVDRALEAVCLKAMARAAGDRYATPRALADDIERWMADEPVSAYREPASARLGRWVRRHKPAVAGAAALLLTAVVALSLSTVLIGLEQAKTREAYRAEAEQRRRAEARSRLARRAVDDMYTQVAERWLAEQPGMLPVQREFLEKARAAYEELADEPGSEPALRREAAAAYRRVGEIEMRLGRQDRAQQGQRKALAIAEELSARSPADPSYRLDASVALVRLGRIQHTTGQYPESEQALRRALGILSDLAQADPGRQEYRRNLAEGHGHLAYLLRLTGRWADAEPEFRRAIDLEETLEREGDQTPATLRWHANALTDYASSLYRVGRCDDAVRIYRQAIGLFDRLITADPGMPLYRGDLTSALVALGHAEAQQGDLADAEREYRRAIDLGRRLVADFPDVPWYRDKLDYAYINLATLLKNTGRPAEAEAAYRQAVELAERLLRESSSFPYLRADLIRNLGSFGSFQQEVGRREEAEATLRRAVQLSERLVADFPEVPDYRVAFLAMNESSLADLLREAGRIPEAEAAYRRALEVLDATPAGAADALAGRIVRATALGHLGQIHMERLDFDEAERLIERALGFGRAALKLAPRHVEPLRVVAVFGSDLARIRHFRDDNAGAAEAAEAARAAGELPRAAGELPQSLIDAASILAHCAPAAGDAAREKEYEDRAMAMLRMAVAKGFKDAKSLAQNRDLFQLAFRPDYQLLIMDLAFPAEPFGATR